MDGLIDWCIWGISWFSLIRGWDLFEVWMCIWGWAFCLVCSKRYLFYFLSRILAMLVQNYRREKGDMLRSNL